MIVHLRDVHRINKDGPMDTNPGVTERIDNVFGKAHQRIQFNLNLFKQLLLRWIKVNHISFRQVERYTFRTLLFYLVGCVRSF